MEAYLDNAATTKPYKEVRDIMIKVMELDYGNPSSMHTKGVEAEQYIKKAKETIASSLKVNSKEIIFTSGGTESNNQALMGTALAYKRSGNHIITTRIEHPSVHNPLIHLEENGFRVSYISVDKNGHVNITELLEAICEETILVSVMYVNNEMGAVEDVTELSRLIKDKKSDIIFHVDAIQAYGKYRIYPKRIGIDLLSVSGHKIHGPKGVGFLYKKESIKMKPIIFGGEQQNGLRSGTENVPGIAGIGVAASLIYEHYQEKIQQLTKLKKLFIDKISKIEAVKVNGLDGIALEDTAPHIISVSFSKIRSEVLLHALEERGVFVSSGSACSSNHPQLSGTLKAISVNKDLLDSTLRFSFSVFTTEEEVNYALTCLEELVPALRKYTRH